MILTGDARDKLTEIGADSVHSVITSPPYWGLRDYNVAGQLGLEPTIDAYIANMARVFADVRRVLRDDGTLWLNMGDAYAQGATGATHNRDGDGGGLTSWKGERGATMGNGLKPKDLIGQPWRLAFALQADGWYLRSDIIWAKPNPMPESVTDRPTKSHEYLFLLSKRERYYYDADAIREPAEYGRAAGAAAFRSANYQNNRSHENSSHVTGGAAIPGDGEGGRNKRDVWTIATQPYPDAHFATFPEALVRPCILAGCPVDGTVLDPFMGSGTVGKVAHDEGRQFIGVELNPEYVALAKRRIDALQTQLPFDAGA